MAKFTLLLQHLGEIYNCCIWHFFPVYNITKTRKVILQPVSSAWTQRPFSFLHNGTAVISLDSMDVTIIFFVTKHDKTVTNSGNRSWTVTVDSKNFICNVSITTLAIIFRHSERMAWVRLYILKLVTFRYYVIPLCH